MLTANKKEGAKNNNLNYKKNKFMTKKNSLLPQITSDLKSFFKKAFSRFYFDSPQVRLLFMITPCFVLDTKEKEIGLCWGYWGVVFWYGKYGE